MRILSQTGLPIVDLPYEKMGVSINFKDNNEIIAYSIDSLDEDDYWTMAIYSDEAKAKRVMEMLRFCYKEHVTEMIYHEGSEYIHPHFQFPADDEIEV